MKPLIKTRRKLRVIGFTSGSGNTLWKAWELQQKLDATMGGCPYEIIGIFSDQSESAAMKKAREYGLKSASIDIREFYAARHMPIKDMEIRKEYDAEALKLYEEWEPDIIMLAGYVWAVTEEITEKYMMLNIHPGDLTIVRDGKRILAGANGITAAFKENLSSLRASAHLVTGQVDGGPILLTSPPVKVDYHLHQDENERFRHYLKLVNEQSRILGARTLLALSLGYFQKDQRGNLFYNGKSIPQGIILDNWDQYLPNCLRNIQKIICPESIAVLGASAKEGIGSAIVGNIINLGFTGKLYAVNVRGEDSEGVKGYASVAEIPGDLDMAVLALPAQAVTAVAEECGRKGVKALICISAGFRETGVEGKVKEQRLKEIVQKYSMSMIGPNCMGIINTDKRISLNATILSNPPQRGNVAMFTQSGALGAAFLDFAKELAIGYSLVVSTGNQADLNVCDFLPLAEEDKNTKVILLYLEEISEPDRFRRIASRMKKPIVVVKAGRTKAGAAAASSHTGSMAGNDAIADALLRQAGVTRAPTLEDAFILTATLAKVPGIKGKKVGILSNTGGLGILVADALTERGYELPELSEESVDRLKPKLLPEASIRNPMDLVAPALPEHYNLAAKEMLSTGLFDVILVTCVPAATVDTESIGMAMADTLHKADIPVLTCFFAPNLGKGAREVMKRNQIPTFEYPEQMADVLDGLQVKKNNAEGDSIESFVEGKSRTREILDCYEEQYLKPEDCCRVLADYGIETAGYAYLNTPEEAETLTLCYPVVAKIDHPEILHKADVGGVCMDIFSKEELNELAKTWFEKFSGLRGVFVQEQIIGKTEMIVGGIKDASCGHGVLVGMGGTSVEVHKDIAFGHVPVEKSFVRNIIQGLREYPVLKGYRGASGVDLEQLEEIVMNINQLLIDFPQIEELDINPLIYEENRKRFVGVDARIKVSK